VALLGDHPGQNLLDTRSSLTLMRPKLVIVVIGLATDDMSILKVIVSGATGYVFEGAAACEFAKAIRSVSRGSVWVSRPVLSMFVEWATSP
jgi:DNA-binding NarL/FixJ family response regulator